MYKRTGSEAILFGNCFRERALLLRRQTRFVIQWTRKGHQNKQWSHDTRIKKKPRVVIFKLQDFPLLVRLHQGPIDGLLYPHIMQSNVRQKIKTNLLRQFSDFTFRDSQSLKCSFPQKYNPSSVLSSSLSSLSSSSSFPISQLRNTL